MEAETVALTEIVYDETTEFNYGFIRKDLSFEQQLVQFGHVCLEAGRAIGRRPDGEPPSHFCLFEVEHEGELIRVFRELGDVEKTSFFETTGDVGFTAMLTVGIRGRQRAIMARYRPYVFTPS